MTTKTCFEAPHIEHEMLATVIAKASTFPDISIRIMLRILLEEGLDTRPALVAAGLPLGLPGQPGTVSPAQEFAFQRAFAQITARRPELWVRAGAGYRLPSFGQLGLALMTCSTLDDYLNTSADTRDLDYSVATVCMLDSSDPHVTGFIFQAWDDSDTFRDFTIYRDIAATLTVLCDLWGGPFPVTSIQVAMPPPTDDEFTILGEQVTFGAERSAILWDKTLNRRALHHGDPELHAAYLAMCRQVGATAASAKDDVVRILRGYIDKGQGTQMSLSMLAGDAGMTERTLQRRLKAHGLAFRDIVDEARHLAAIEMLTSSEAPITEIAFRLGYSDTISFSHAFRRWTGTSPAAARRGRL